MPDARLERGAIQDERNVEAVALTGEVLVELVLGLVEDLVIAVDWPPTADVLHTLELRREHRPIVELTENQAASIRDGEHLAQGRAD